MTGRAKGLGLFLGVALMMGFTPCGAQRHLPDLQIFQTPAVVRLVAPAEKTSENDREKGMRRSGSGESFSIQIFIPGAAGLRAFECSIELETGPLDGVFHVVSAQDWLGSALKPSGADNRFAFHSMRLALSPVPESGHIATVALSLRRPLETPVPIPIACTITVVSEPPRRVWQMRGTQSLSLRGMD